MTLNLLFFTIIIRKRKVSTEEHLHQARIEKLMEEQKDKHMSHHRYL
ncbi:YrzI family small protein [Niallia sp. MER 6]|nr:YrzI family small protein [Niallia sp. MER 6]MCM3030062.1 YrzI family small protein [Niallia sp. MER 6]